MVCYHSTAPDRVERILRDGLRPNSPPTWFSRPAPYVMLSRKPWLDLNGETTVVLEVSDPSILTRYFEKPFDPEGLRWPYEIKPEYIKVVAGWKSGNSPAS